MNHTARCLPTLIAASLAASLLLRPLAGQEMLPAADLTAPQPLGTGFTYQGRLSQGSGAVDGTCDLRFILYDASIGGSQVGPIVVKTGVAVTDGLLTVPDLDFGEGAFAGSARWLDIAVRCPAGSGDYAALSVRQPLAAAPGALFSRTGPWSGLLGVPAASGDLSGTYPGLTVSGLQGRPVAATAPASNHVLKWGGAQWAPATDKDTTYTAGDGLTLVGTELRASGTPFGNVVIVAKSGGDFTTVQAAVDSIGSATAGNPFLVWVAPGVYSETVALKPYVHLQGAGRQATIITSAATASTDPFVGTLTLAHHTSVQDLTVENTGTGAFNMALLAPDDTTEARASHVTAHASGASTGNNYAVYVTGVDADVTLVEVVALGEGGLLNFGLGSSVGASVTLRGGSFTGSGGSGTWGVANDGLAELDAEGITVLADGSSGSAYGLYNTSATVHLRGGSYTARGGSTARGIYNHYSQATLTAVGVTALGENGSNSNYGLDNDDAIASLSGGSFTARGGSNQARAIYNHLDDAVLEAVAVTAAADTCSATNDGLSNGGAATASLFGGSYTGRGGTASRGINVNDASSSVTAHHVSALAEGSVTINHGLSNASGRVVLHGGSFTAHNGEARGIYNIGVSGALEATGVAAVAESGSSNRGLSNYNATADVTNSVLEGATSSVHRDSGTVTVSNSRLIGASSGTVTCTAVSRGTTFNATGCP